MRKSTMVELVQELESIPNKSALINVIIAEAKAGEYHDYKNEKYVCGKVALIEHLCGAGLTDLAERVKNGEFDEEADEQDKAMLSQMLNEIFSSPLSRKL